MKTKIFEFKFKRVKLKITQVIFARFSTTVISFIDQKTFLITSLSKLRHDIGAFCLASCKHNVESYSANLINLKVTYLLYHQYERVSDQLKNYLKDFIINLGSISDISFNFFYLKMSLAVTLPYKSFTTSPAPPPTPILGPMSIKPVKIDLELLEDILLFGDLTKTPKQSKTTWNCWKSLHSLLQKLMILFLNPFTFQIIHLMRIQICLRRLK